MANMIQDIATDIGNFAAQNYSYPLPSSSPETLAYYEAVSWSGVALLADPTGAAPYIENPIFVANYPNLNDSCFLFKEKTLEASGEIKLVYSRNELTPGKFKVDQYLIKLIQPNFILLRDTDCLHCSSLEFYKAR